MRVLIADDDRIASTILAAALREWKFEVIATFDGASAWQRLLAEKPGMAIVDWVMPEIDGPELCRRIRLEPSIANTHLILLTSRDSRSDRVAGLDAGANDFVSKPFDREELRARVQVGARVAAIQAELQHKIRELQKALNQVEVLEGLLPICSYCKRIRSEDDSWEQMESYVSSRTRAEFSHGVCPTCLENVLKGV